MERRVTGCFAEGGAVRRAVRDDGAWRVLERPLSCPEVPALCVDGDGALWGAYVDDDGRAWVCALDGDDVTARHRVDGVRTHSAASIAAWHGKLCVAVTGDDGHLYVASARDPASLRLRRAHADALAQGAPAIAGTPARLHLAFTGTDGRVYLASSDDGRTFEFSAVAGKVRAGGAPALSAWGPQLALAVTDTRGHVHTASSYDPVEMRLALRGGPAVTRSGVALALVERTVLAVIAGTDGALYAAQADVHGELDFAPDAERNGVHGRVAVASTREGEAREPSRTQVVPVLFVARDVGVEADALARALGALRDHLALAQARYRRWLVTDTFAYTAPVVVNGQHPLASYHGDAAWDMVRAEVLTACGDNLDTSVAAYLVLVARPGGSLPDAGGFGAGGPGRYDGSGMVMMELTSVLEDRPYPFQSTLVHELGHAFGLGHVDELGESMDTCESIMSYNPRHHTVGLSPPEPDGTLLPEEFESLGRNEVAFPDFAYDPARHNPTGRRLRR